MDGAFWMALFHILMIDLVLSGDNAIVIGMACRGLPSRQRRTAVLWGTGGAVLLRAFLTGMATWLLAIPLVKLVGGLLLCWISWKLLREEEAETSEVMVARTLGGAIKTIILADFIMSLDNVLAIGGAAHGDVILVVIGLGVSIPLLMIGSAFVVRLLNRFPLLLYAGAGILMYTAVRMCLEDASLATWTGEWTAVHGWIAAGMSILIPLAARLKSLRG